MRIFRSAVSAIAILFATLFVLAADPPATKVVMLGTGTPRPVPERLGPSTAIVVGDRAYLVDIGAGVVRRAAAAAAQGLSALEPPRLAIAFITHLHSDHTIGYPDLILTPWVMGRSTLTVYGPQGTEEMTRDILKAWHRDIEIRTNGLEQRGPLRVQAHDVKPGVVYKDDVVTVTAFRVAHGQWPDALGYRFNTRDRIIVISGDTSPSEELIAQCKGCSVLIHEAYSPDAPSPMMPDWPAYRAKYHTSTDQLAEIANRAKPDLLIVYHTSSRVPDEQILREIQKTYHGKVVISRDLDVY
jgi:ribonuclease BN (tRNA processing enzyme)